MRGGQQGSRGRQNRILHPLTRAPDHSVACRHVPPTKNRTDFGGRATSHEARQAARQGAAVESSLGGNRVASRGISYQVTATNPQCRGEVERWRPGPKGQSCSQINSSLSYATSLALNRLTSRPRVFRVFWGNRAGTASSNHADRATGEGSAHLAQRFSLSCFSPCTCSTSDFDLSSMFVQAKRLLVHLE